MRRISFFLVFCLATIPAAFSQKNIANQYGGWLIYVGNHKLSDQFSLHTEYQMRRSDFLAHWQQSIARVGLDYHFNKANALTAGYAWVEFFPYGDQPIATYKAEHRIWEQFINKSKLGRVNLTHRFRLEQRFIENAYLNEDEERKVDGFTFKQRVRYNLILAVPLNHKEMTDNTLFLGLYDEIFIGFGKNTGTNILHQNQFYAGLGWKFNTKTKLQFGYLNQMLIKSNGIDMERNHNLRLLWSYSLDFTKHN
jgi:hypothetical protein